MMVYDLCLVSPISRWYTKSLLSNLVEVPRLVQTTFKFLVGAWPYRCAQGGCGYVFGIFTARTKRAALFCVRRKTTLAFFLAFLALPTPLPAQDINAQVIEDLQNLLREETQQWFAPVQAIAMWLLLSLSIISWTWTGAQMVLKNADLQEFVGEFVRLVLFTGFFIALITNAQSWSTALIDGFMWSANEVAGARLSGELTPAAILDRGLSVAGLIWQSGGWGVVAILYALASLACIFMYAGMAAYVLLVIAELYIVTTAGVLFLGFAGSQWSSEYARSYITYCFAVGAKLYVLFLVAGLGEQFVYRFAMDPQIDRGSFMNVFTILGVLVMIFVLTIMIPSIVQSMINGRSAGSPFSPNGISAYAAGMGAAATSYVAGSGLAVREAARLAEAQVQHRPSSAPLRAGFDARASSLNRHRSRAGYAWRTASNLGSASLGVAGARLRGERRSNARFPGAMAQHIRDQVDEVHARFDQGAHNDERPSDQRGRTTDEAAS